jgi:hypothetical protein
VAARRKEQRQSACAFTRDDEQHSASGSATGGCGGGVARAVVCRGAGRRRVAVRAEPLCDALQADVDVDAQLRDAADEPLCDALQADVDVDAQLRDAAETARRGAVAGRSGRRCAAWCTPTAQWCACAAAALRCAPSTGACSTAARCTCRRRATPSTRCCWRSALLQLCGMYYSDDELLLMKRGSLRDAPIGARLGICAPTRRHLLRARAAQQQQLALALRRSITTRRTDNVQKTLEHAAPDFAPSDVAAVVALVGTPLTGAAFGAAAFDLPAPADVLRLVREAEQRRALQTALDATSARWRCADCTYVNSADDPACAVCELSWSGRRAPRRRAASGSAPQPTAAARSARGSRVLDCDSSVNAVILEQPIDDREVSLSLKA